MFRLVVPVIEIGSYFKIRCIIDKTAGHRKSREFHLDHWKIHTVASE